MGTNARTFRTHLSEYLDLALKKPVAISRGTDRFVLLNEEEFLKLKDEVTSLQRNLLAMLEVREGRSFKTETASGFEALFDEISAKVRKKNRGKKASGE